MNEKKGKEQMRRISILIITAVIVVSLVGSYTLAGCAPVDEPVVDEPEPVDEPVVDEPEPVDEPVVDEPPEVDFDALYEEVSDLEGWDAYEFFESLPERGLNHDQVLEFFINLPLSDANEGLYQQYMDEDLGFYAEIYPEGPFYDDYSWEKGAGTVITGPFSGLELKLPFTDYIPIPEGPVGDPEETYRIGTVFHGFDHPWLINWADSAKWQADQHPNVEMTVLDAEYDNARMATYIDQFIAEEVDGILVWPMEVAPTGPPVDRALEAGIPVVSSDRLTGSEDINSRVTGGLPSNGAQMGMYIAHKLAEEGSFDANMVMLRKPLGASSEALRTGYLIKVLSYFPGINVLESYHDTDDREEAYRNAESALAAYPDLDIFYGTGDHQALAAIEAADLAGRTYSREDGKKIIFVCPDDSKEAMYYIEEGIMDMNVPLTPLQADIATRVLINIITGREEMPYNVIVPDAPMVTIDGAEIFGFQTLTTDGWYEYTWGPPVE